VDLRGASAILLDPSPALVVGTPRGRPSTAGTHDRGACATRSASPEAGLSMTQFQTQAPAFRLKEGVGGRLFVDYRSTDDLRRLMTPNGKIYSRKRTGLNAQQQLQVAQAIKRARFMALLPYTSATM
jgi:small subunit ribosomal protein S18